jgi:hypothetical protein
LLPLREDAENQYGENKNDAGDAISQAMKHQAILSPIYAARLSPLC